MMIRALVTGATGFLGRHICDKLAQMNWDVSALGRNDVTGRELEASGIRFIHADLKDKERVVQACAGQDMVFHCGALSAPWGSYREFYDSNVLGTRHIAAGCARHAVNRLIHISTPSVYFDYTHRELIRESDPLPPRPANAYAATKRLAEEEVMRAIAGGVPGLILRPKAIFGPRDRALFPRLLRANGKRGVPLMNGGNVRLDLTYVDNVAEAMLLGCKAPESALGRAYNITNGEPVLLLDVLTQLFEMLDIPFRKRSISYPIAYGIAGLAEMAYKALPIRGEPLITRFTVGVMAKNQTLDITEARERLGYVPLVTVREGLQAFADWWRENL